MNNNNQNNEHLVDSSPSDNRCLIELSSPLAPAELDFLTLYLESKKQSGGGDILKVLLNEDSTQMTVFYEGLAPLFFSSYFFLFYFI